MHTWVGIYMNFRDSGEGLGPLWWALDPTTGPWGWAWLGCAQGHVAHLQG